jgi:Glycoside Hydrolase Family 113/Carboxypeptidase regulatory-like domain
MTRHLNRIFILALVNMLILSACTWSLLNIPGLTSTNTPPTPSGLTPTPIPAASIVFYATLPSPLLPGEILYLSVVDEVTGLGLNPTNYAMQGMDTLHYTLTLPFPIGSVVKYRYIRQSTLPILEDDSADRPVRYRLYHASAPGSVQDIISSWTDSLFAAPSGRITGKVLNAADSRPITNILIAVGGQQTLTDSTGSFVIEGLPTGTHNLVAYALDGSFQTFQQGAVVMENKTTPASISLVAAPLVNVIFTVSVPEDTIANIPIRLAGNLYTLGNTFGDLDGGLSSVASRMPVLSPLEDGRYSLSLMLPAGADIRYKYTLGDGFWNAEHTQDRAFVLRQLIVPSGQSLVQTADVVTAWQDGTSSPILFEVTVPAETPVTDIISIQFNPYGWTVPIPMWAMGNNKWTYQLYSPLNILDAFEYRYCRNEQCGLADDVQTGPGSAGRLVSSSLAPQDLQDSVTDWMWLEPLQPAQLVGLPVTPRTSGFWAGVEFLPTGNPTWQSWMPLAVLNVQALYANWLVLTPTWTVTRDNPFSFAPLPGEDPLFTDTMHLIAGAHALNLNTALFPGANLPGGAEAWWQSIPHDATWWNAWFDRYKAFAVYHADLASQAGTQVLILGGSWVQPALPGGQIGGTSSGVPADAESRWQAILAEVRNHFNGSVLWAISYPGGLTSTPAFIGNFDGIYLLWNAPLSNSSSPSIEEMRITAGALLDNEVKTFQSALGKPVIIAAAYPSADGAALALTPMETTLQPGNTAAAVNLQTQADIYQALLAAINERAWVSGFVSRGYYPPAVLHDASASIHGKPAADFLWYWFPRFLGITP